MTAATKVSWRDMRRRCQDSARPNFRFYGARGISVCERWASFENFLADMGPRPKGMSLDRIDNLRGYEPDNCRWTDHPTQCRNRRSTKLSPDIVQQIRAAHAAGEGYRPIARRLGVAFSTVAKVVTGRSWT